MKKLILFGLLFVSALSLTGCSNESANIGIIGGADGPTAVFVSSNIDLLTVCGFIGVIIAIVLIAVVIRNRKKK